MMTQGPQHGDPNAMVMDPSTMYYTGMNPYGRSMSDVQVSLRQTHADHNAYAIQMNGDSSMSGMLDDSMMDFDNLPMTLDDQLLDNNDMNQKPFASMNAMAQQQQKPQPLLDGTNAIEGSNGDQNMNVIGGGPLPHGFNAAAAPNLGSTLTEFTKRRNWSQKVVEELKDFLHILTPDGRIVYTSPSVKQLTGYEQDDLVGRFIVDFIHPDDSAIFVREFNESIASGNLLRFFYRFKKQNGEFTIFESHGHPHLTSEAAQFGPGSSASFCRGFFMMARPYPAKNAGLLDSFLEHKIENERLTKRIADLKREEAEEAEDAQRHWQKKLDKRSDITPSEDMESSIGTTLMSMNSDTLAMPPPAKPSSMHVELTQQNLEDANAGSKADTINDKMARYEGATHIETIEMLTGLRYQDGERSRGISTGDMSPALIRGDAGIAIPVDKEARGGDKKKKLKVADEYVCTDCGMYRTDLAATPLTARRHSRFAGMEKRPKWSQDIVQCLWTSMGQEREKEGGHEEWK